MASVIKKRGKLRYRGSVMVRGEKREKLFPDASMTSKREAIVWEKEEKERMEKEQSRTNLESLMIVKWTNDYLEEAKARFSEKTFKEKKSAFTRFVSFDALEPQLPVHHISIELCRKFLTHQSKIRSGYAANKDRKNLGTAWNWGIDNLRGFPGGKNPFHSIKKYPEERSIRYVPPEGDFWDAYYVADGQDQVMLLTYYYLAARRNEVFQLKWTDLDFYNDQVRLWTRKRKGGDREPDWLPMTTDLKNALLSWRKERLSQVNTNDDYVFVCLEKYSFSEDYYGKPFKVRQHFMKKLCKKANVRHFGFHSIRHLVATTLYHKGCNISELQAILRHKSPSTTEKYLRSLGIRHVRKALENGLSRPKNVLEKGLSSPTTIIPFPKQKTLKKNYSEG
jgi:integrase